MVYISSVFASVEKLVDIGDKVMDVVALTRTRWDCCQVKRRTSLFPKSRDVYERRVSEREQKEVMGCPNRSKLGKCAAC